MSTVRSVYAFRHRNNVLERSSSGGAFSAICDVLFKNNTGGVTVYGAAFDDELNVRHQKAQNRSECDKFCGSKYVQSNISGIFEDIVAEIDCEKMVLFTGTPCQVNSVRQYCLRNNINTSQLYLVDIICHGTAKPEIWKAYRSWLEDKYSSRIVDFKFRYKKTRWKSYPVYVRFENGKRLVNTFDARLYTNLFLSTLILRDCCYKCPFANMDRPSDLTIGDFWGLSSVMPDFPKGNGTSEILVNSDKGEQIICELQKLQGVTIEQCHSDAYIKYQHNLNEATLKSERLSEFNDDLKNKSFDDVLKIYAGNNPKGRMVYFLKRICGEIGLTEAIKHIAHK